MKTRLTLVIVSLLLSVLIGLSLGRQNTGGADQDKRSGVLIGLSLDTLKEERWQKDREMFEKRANELGATVMVQAANGDDTAQISDVQKLINQKVDVLVIVPHDGKAMAKAVELAHEAGIPVIAYDRLIKDSDLDLYVSFDNVRVGELQARYLVDHLPTPGRGRIVRIYGAKTDNNAALFKAGQDSVLDPLIKSGAITVLHEDWAEDWKPENAKRIMNAAMTAKGSKIDAVLASNDGTAGGAVQALSEEGLAGKVLVTGQDADVVALQRINGGTQAMTIYKPLHLLAQGTADLAVRMGSGKPVIATKTVNNGAIDVPSVLNDVVTVTKENIEATVVKDGFVRREDIFK
jgi:D-xylose transport system substrate-binding protein